MSNCKSLFGLEELLSPGPGVDTAGIVFRGWWCEVFGQFFHTGRSYPTSGGVSLAPAICHWSLVYLYGA